MTEPSPSELLAGVADALEQTVLPGLERGQARNQVMAAIGIVRRCGGAIDRYGPILHAECLDLITTLRQVITADLSLASTSREHDLDFGEELLAGAYPVPSDLAEVHANLSGHLAAMLVESQRAESGLMPELRQLLDRMTARDEELGLSPW